VLLLATTLAAAGVAWQQWLHSPHETGAGHQLAVGHWALDAALALPVVLAAVVLTGSVVALLVRLGAAGGRTQTVLTAALAGTGASAVLALGGPVHAPLLHGTGAHGGGGVLLHALREVLVGLPITVPTALAVLLLLRLRLPRPEVSPRRVLAGLTGAALVSGMVVGLPTAATAAPTANGPCPAGARDITYDLAAFQNVIPINGWGDRLPDGLQYALRGDDARVGKKQIVEDPKLSQPVVIRANVGDCVTVSLRNDIAARRVGLHPDGLVQFDPKTSDGARVGNNPDTTVATGQTISYTWYADRVGEAPVLDVANLDESGPGGSTVQLGLYGAVIVHPTGSTWHDTVTGANLLAGTRAVETDVFADVRTPGEDYRSFAMVFMDENEDIVDRNGKTPTFPSTGLEDPTFGINYRSEPLRNRLRAVLEHRGTKTPENPNGVKKTITLPNGTTYAPEDHFCDGWYKNDSGTWVEPAGGGAEYAKCMGEEMHLQSWIFGDEGTLYDSDRTIVSDNLIPKAYRGDKTRFHIVHPGAKETHPWHQHTQRWVTDPDHPDRTNTADRIRKDVQSVSPGEAFPLELEGGAGGTQGTIGDSIFHCHLYPHFAGGFWGHLRIYDKLRDGTQSLPDGTRMQALQQLPDRNGQTPAATTEQPGFPLFVKSDVGQRAFRPPNSVIKDDFAAIRRPGDAPRTATALEAASMPALSKNPQPGVGVIDPCPTGAPTRTYTPHVTDGKIVYNSAGWHDRQGRVYARDAAEAAAIRVGKNPEPYTIRARMGECIKVELRNELHLDEDPSKPIDHVNRLDGVYMSTEETGEVSTHVHLVKFDQITSDGTSVGWNYTQAAMPGQTFGYRWFADVALRTVFFHDHQYANLHQQKGLFAAMNVEPVDATWHDPKTGTATDGVGPVADIRSASGPDFREITVFHQDRAPMWKGAGNDTAGASTADGQRLRRRPGRLRLQLPQRAVPDPDQGRGCRAEGRSGLHLLIGGAR
jgi:hypothetical protein